MKSDIYLKAYSNITGIINTDSGAINLTIMPEYPCKNIVNPCINGQCTRTIDQGRFECICNTGYGPVINIPYECEGSCIYKIFYYRFLRLLFI